MTRTVSKIVVPRDRAEGDDSFDLSFRLLAYWERLFAEGRARRSFLDPLLFGPILLPHLVVLNVIDDGRDFEWRLFGGAHIREYGVNLTGVRIGDLMQENAGLSEVLEIFRLCREEAAPQFSTVRYLSREGMPRRVNGLLTPLFGDDNRTVTHILGCSQWLDDRGPDDRTEPPTDARTGASAIPVPRCSGGERR